MVSVSVCYLFYQPIEEKNQTWTLRFPAKENPNMERALFDWLILLQYDVKAISRKFFGHEVFSAERSLNQPKATRVCIRSINQSNRFISVRLLFLFFVRAFSFQGHTKIALTSPRRADEPEGSEPERRKFAPCKGIRIPESRNFLLVESGIQGFGIRNPAPGIRNPTY